MKAFLRSIWYFLTRHLLLVLPDRYFIELSRRITYWRLGYAYYPLNWNCPRTFNEHLNTIKLQSPDPTWTRLADKWAVREYVKEKVGAEILIPVLTISKDAREIDFQALPDSFIIKANHGSGWNLLCFNKNELNQRAAVQKLNYWLKQNAWFLSREPQYRNIEPKLVIEEIIAKEPNDYKFFCVDGEVKCVQVDYARHTKHQRSIFNMKWEKLPFHIRYQEIEEHIPPPVNLTKMIEVAATLSEGLRFCRIDLYEISRKIYFGEITLFPGGGQEPFHSYEEDLEFANYLGLNQ